MPEKVSDPKIGPCEPAFSLEKSGNLVPFGEWKPFIKIFRSTYLFLKTLNGKTSDEQADIKCKRRKRVR